MSHSSIGLPPPGAGPKLHTHEVDHNGDVTHNQIMSLGDPEFSDRLQYVDEYGSAYVRFAEGNQIFDSFGKTKISQETLVGEYMPTYDLLPELVWTDTSGTASELHLPNESSIRLQTGTVSGDSIQRTTHKYHKYFPGTSQLIEFTIVAGDAGKTNVNRRWGYYDDNDGIIFSMTGTAFQLILRSSVSGTPVDTVIDQANFNRDKGDGTGISGLTVNPIFANIYWIDLQWLGAGRVRCGGYSTGGQRVVFHEMENANNLASVYMKTGSLPLRWEQFNTGIASSTSEMKVLNAAVYTEASDIDFNGRCFSTAALTGAVTPKTTIPTTGIFKAIVSVRPKLLYKGKTNRHAMIPKHVLINTDTPLQLTIMKNITPTGGETWAATSDDSGMEKSTNIELSVNGDPRYCSLVPAGTSTLLLDEAFNYLNTYIALQADGVTQDTWTICVRTLDNTAANVVAGLTWTELET